MLFDTPPPMLSVHGWHVPAAAGHEFELFALHIGSVLEVGTD
jgi:hypothetical protein